MNNLSFYGNIENKTKLLNKLTSKRLIKEIEWQGNKSLNRKKFATPPTTTLAVKTLEKSLNETILEYKNDYNIPSSFTRLIESLYQESEQPTKFTIPERIIRKTPISKNLNYVWLEFNIEALINPEFGIIHLTKNKKIINLIIKVAKFYKEYKESLIHFNNGEKIMEENKLRALKDEFSINEKEIEKLPLSNVSMMLFSINNSIIDESYIYDTYAGIYKAKQLTQEHYLFYLNKIEEIIKKTEEQILFDY